MMVLREYDAHVSWGTSFATSSTGENAAGESGNCGVHGRFSPELFLPWEIFGHLLRLRFGPMQDEVRESILTPIEDRLAEHGLGDAFGEDFWKRLHGAAREYVDAAYPSKDKGQGATSGPADDETLRCRQRAKALARVRQTFGAERFDRFLYEVVAPNMNVSTPCSTEWKAQFQFIEGGCR